MNLSTIRTLARNRLDEETAVFWTDPSLNGWINEGYYYYWKWLIKASYPGALARTTLNVVADTPTIALPSDFHKVRLAEKWIDPVWVPMNYVERFEDFTDTTSQAWTGDERHRFCILGQNLLLDPIPSDSVTDGIRLTYYFIPSRMVNDVDSPNAGFSDFFHELLVLYCVKAAKGKEEGVSGGGTDYAPFLSELAQLEEQFKETIEPITQHRSYTEPFGIDFT